MVFAFAGDSTITRFLAILKIIMLILGCKIFQQQGCKENYLTV
jgi:hypothetical protein